MKHLMLFENYTTPQVSLIEEEDIPGVVDVLYAAFGHIDDKVTIATKLRPRMCNGLSLKLTLGDQIIGCYLLHTKSINQFIKEIREGLIKDFKAEETQIRLEEKVNDKGLQGIALSVLPQWRGQGYGELLRDWYSRDLRFDYVWGVQDKKLGNITHWQKTRSIFAESPTHFATIKKLR